MESGGPEESFSERLMQQIRMFMALKHFKTDGVPIEVVENVFLGSIGAAMSKKRLQNAGITHILTIANKISPFFPEEFVYRVVAVVDTAETNIAELFPECLAFIEEGRRQGKVLVHCFAGRSRSVTVLTAYLMKCHGLGVEEALGLLKEKRPESSPNSGFLEQLKDYERSLVS